MISNFKITANNDFKMVSENLRGGGKSYLYTDYTLSPVTNKIQTGLCVIHWKNVTTAGKKLSVREPACDTKQSGCRNSSGNTNLWPLLKPIESRKIVCMKLK